MLNPPSLFIVRCIALPVNAGCCPQHDLTGDSLGPSTGVPLWHVLSTRQIIARLAHKHASIQPELFSTVPAVAHNKTILTASSIGHVRATQGPIPAVTDGKLAWHNEWNMEGHGIRDITQPRSQHARVCRSTMCPTMHTSWSFLPVRGQRDGAHSRVTTCDLVPQLNTLQWKQRIVEKANLKSGID